MSYPGAERTGDDSRVVAWAGWDHLQQAQALAEYLLTHAQGWPRARVLPLLAGLADLLPWLKQWHNEPDPNLGMGLGDYFSGFLEEQARFLGTTIQALDLERFESATTPSAGAVTRLPRRKPEPIKAGSGVMAAEDWQDRAFSLLAAKRTRLSDYRMLVWPELLRQMKGDLDFERFRKAYWLLSEPKELERLGRAILPDLPESWWQSRAERLEKSEFLGTLKGAVMLGDVRIWREDDSRYIRWTGDLSESVFPEAVDDARVALQLATQWTDEMFEERETFESEIVQLEAT